MQYLPNVAGAYTYVRVKKKKRIARNVHAVSWRHIGISVRSESFETMEKSIAIGVLDVTKNFVINTSIMQESFFSIVPVRLIAR